MERNGRETDPNQGQSDSLSCDLHCHFETCSAFKLGTVRGARAKMQPQLRLRTSHTSTLVPTHFLVPSSRPLWDLAPGSAFRLSGTPLNLIINLSSPAHISSMWILLRANEHFHHIFTEVSSILILNEKSVLPQFSSSAVPLPVFQSTLRVTSPTRTLHVCILWNPLLSLSLRPFPSKSYPLYGFA